MSGVDVLDWFDAYIERKGIYGGDGIAPREAVKELFEAASAYFNNYCVDEADEFFDDDERVGEYTGCTREQSAAAKRLRAALAPVGGAA